MKLTFILFIASRLGYVSPQEECTTINGEVGACVHLLECPIIFAALANAKQSAVGTLDKHFCKAGKRDMVCCKRVSLNNPYLLTNTYNITNRAYCGFQHSDDYYHPDNEVSIFEFPWLALIVLHISDKNEYRSFPICSGTLISQRYVLTSTDCLTKHQDDRISVRLGKFSTETRSKADCFENKLFNTSECSDSEEFEVTKRILHPYRVGFTYNNNIALLRLARNVQYSDVIRPICLPDHTNLSPIKSGTTLFVSGWNDQFFVKGNTTKRKISTTLITNEQCGGLLRTTITPYNLCTIGRRNNTESQCYLDKGGPLVFPYKNQWFLEGVLSEFAGRCDNSAPLIFMKVFQYLEWIYDNMQE